MIFIKFVLQSSGLPALLDVGLEQFCRCDLQRIHKVPVRSSFNPSCPSWRGLGLIPSYWGSSKAAAVPGVGHYSWSAHSGGSKGRDTHEDREQEWERRIKTTAQGREEEEQLPLFFLHLPSAFCCSFWTMHNVGDPEPPSAGLELSLLCLILPASLSISVNQGSTFPGQD